MAKIFYAARDRGDFARRCNLGRRWLYRLRRWQDSPPRISKRTATTEKICRRTTTLGDDRARGSCAPSPDVNRGAEGALVLASSSPQGESVRWRTRDCSIHLRYWR